MLHLPRSPASLPEGLPPAIPRGRGDPTSAPVPGAVTNIPPRWHFGWAPLAGRRCRAAPLVLAWHAKSVAANVTSAAPSITADGVSASISAVGDPASVSGRIRRLYEFELEPEVRDWLDSLSDSDFKRVDEVCGMLAEKGTELGGPWSDHLEGAVWELRVRLRDVAARITYWCTAEGTIVLLTVFRKTRQHDQKQIDRTRSRPRVVRTPRSLTCQMRLLPASGRTA